MQNNTFCSQCRHKKKTFQHQINTGGSNHRGKSTPWPLSLKYEWQTPRAHKKHTIWSLNSCTNPHCSFASSPTVLGVHDLHSLEQSTLTRCQILTVPFTFAKPTRLKTLTNSYFTHYPSIFSELSRLILWSSSAITTVSCFFLSFVIVFVVIEPILSNANWKRVNDHQPMSGKRNYQIIKNNTYDKNNIQGIWVRDFAPLWSSQQSVFFLFIVKTFNYCDKTFA